MFGELTDRLDDVFRKLKGQGFLTEKNIKDSLREIRRALLEADVNFKIVKKFIKDVEAKAIGVEVLKSLQPGHQVVKIVHEELIKLMGDNQLKIRLYDNKITKIMMVGLQGSKIVLTELKTVIDSGIRPINPMFPRLANQLLA